MTDRNTTYLLDQFHQDMVGIFEKAKKELKYNASYFIQMVSEHGGLKAAQILLAMREPSSGFTVLWEHERLDLSVEALVLREEYAPLFMDEERAIARNRLEQYGYKFD